MQGQFEGAPGWRCRRVWRGCGVSHTGLASWWVAAGRGWSEVGQERCSRAHGRCHRSISFEQGTPWSKPSPFRIHRQGVLSRTTSNDGRWQKRFLFCSRKTVRLIFSEQSFRLISQTLKEAQHPTLTVIKHPSSNVSGYRIRAELRTEIISIWALMAHE